MINKKHIFILIGTITIIVLLFVIKYSKHVFVDKYNDKLLNYNFKISNFNKEDKILSRQRYAYTTRLVEKYIAVIIVQSHKASIKQYLIKNNEVLNLSIPQNCQFVISLYANRTITYTWNIKNNIDNNIIKLESRSWIDIPTPISERGYKGTSYDRQNLYFKSLKTGNEKIIMKYEHITKKDSEPFNITLNINIIHQHKFSNDHFL